MGQVNRGLNGMMDNLWKVNQAADLMGRMSDTMGRMSQPFAEYDQSLADLSAITGIAGADLDSLGKTARKVGKQSGLGASGALEAYKLLASQIDVSKIGIEGLNMLQKETITLAQASGMSMAESANSLAGTINQFGLTADQANRVINVLAAGSKYGAAEIPELSQSFKVVGAAASAAGLSVEQTGGALETLSKANLKGAEAGTALRNVLLKMQTQLGIDFKVTKLSDALKTLAGKEGDAAYMAKIFGAENIAAAQFLVKNADLVDEMTGRMTDTSVATEQANIRNKTFNHRMMVMKARLNDLSIGFFKSNAGLLQFVQLGGQGAMAFTSLSPLAIGLGKGLVGTVGGFARTVQATRLLSAALKAGRFETYSALIGRYGFAGKVAAGGIWLKNKAVSFGVFVGKLFNSTTRNGMLLQMRQAVVSKTLAAWTWVVTKAQLVASGITALWGKRMMVTSALQAGWSKVLVVSSMSMKGLATSLTGVIAKTWAWTAALFANPVTWIVAGVMALVAAILLAWKHFDGFRGVLVGAWEGMKKLGEIIFGSVLGGLKQLLVGIGKIGKAIALLFKGQFKEAGKTAMEGLGNIGQGFFKSTPFGVVAEVVNRRDEVGQAASAGYNKGKAIDTSSFLYQSKKKDQPLTMADMQFPQKWPLGVTAEITAARREQPEATGRQYAIADGMANKGEEYGGMKTELAPMPKMSAVKVPGILDLSMPSIGMMKIPGMLDMTMPDFGATELAGKKNLPVAQQPPNYVLRGENNKLDQVTKNITQTIVQNETRTQNQNQSQTSKIEVNYQPNIQISAAMTKESRDNLMTMLRAEKEQLMKLINEEQRKAGRLSYAG